MLTDFLLPAGIVLGIVSAIWFLFAAYSCDVSLARWMFLFPPLGLVFVFRYPETCLRPFIVNLLALLLIGLGVAFSAVNAVNSLDVPAPSPLSN
jgi:hypothetical protein